ncbi:MAG: zinc ribbon domain-containing protein [Firmicutes bacterium]|nr:zinc ribbon domain-containing protein [Bacillota bacterium]
MFYNNGLFDAMFVIIPILVCAGFVFTIVMMFSSKARGKMMNKEVRATRYMMEDMKDDIQFISDEMADATKGAVQTTVHAIKEGIVDDEPQVYCKHCGAQIDADSKFCKVCGKEQ